MDSTANGTAAASGVRTPAEAGSHNASFWALTLGCVGVVYGDIGTSPLYAFREAVVAAQGSGPVTREIQTAYLDTVNGRNEQWSHWLDVVDVVPAQA